MTIESDNVYERLTETSIPAPTIDHVWTFDVPAGSKIWLHFEGFRTDNAMQEYFDLVQVTNGANDPAICRIHDTMDTGHDYRGELPLSAQGTVEIRLVDKFPEELFPEQDTVSMDQLWIRVVP